MLPDPSSQGIILQQLLLCVDERSLFRGARDGLFYPSLADLEMFKLKLHSAIHTYVDEIEAASSHFPAGHISHLTPFNHCPFLAEVRTDYVGFCR